MQSDFDPEPYESTPGNEPEQPEANIKETLLELNSDMGALTMLLRQLVESSFNQPTGLVQSMPTGRNLESPTGSSLNGPTGSDINLPTGHTESTGQNSLTADNDCSSPMSGPSNIRTWAASDELQTPEPPAKSSKEGESDNDDIISIHADQDLEHDNAADKNFVDEIAEGFDTSDDVGENINEKLAAFVENRWGKQLKSEKIKAIIGKYNRPKNCKKLHTVKVNKGAWENLKWEKKQADLRLSNMQLMLTKVGCITLQMADFLLKNLINFDDNGELNHHISMSYDSVALLGYLIGDLSNQRRLTMKNALKSEYQALCLSST